MLNFIHQKKNQVMNTPEEECYKQLKEIAAKYDMVISWNPRKFTEVWELSKMANESMDQRITITLSKQRQEQCNNSEQLTFDPNLKNSFLQKNSHQ